MTALAIDPSEIKITDYRAIRDRLMLGGAIPKPVLDALVLREHAVEEREEKVARAEAASVVRARDLSAREWDLDRRERAFALRLGEEAAAETQAPSIARPPLRTILIVVARRWGVEVDDLIATRRTQKLVEPRRAFYAISRQLTLRSVAEIGRMLSRDHTTALHHIIRAEPIMVELRQALTAGTGLDSWVEAYYRKVAG
ncbi:helix-turn-helix domain-containing protein [Labrys sp. KB_33_2]|uniref:helix-turn-helix domain-containing protein n=1 Tax=Labrys sp. KB_33_2 TaxID=3237479 RepID=UPI003F939E04